MDTPIRVLAVVNWVWEQDATGKHILVDRFPAQHDDGGDPAGEVIVLSLGKQ